ncbi:hydrolase 1, exosortase A system-associated [Sphingomonas sp. gentR]|jgi:exosortase A-associated hydrolase 1|uniref:hydrolase 1, exosortase A system-associated n=1 Tax=unclassified Sphingomonas TaxID=196159 RepID=UPI000972E608|nr:hydrolase 1, exosortase A system-associated [Sphingomonas sp. LK11]APX66731.1 alpha/beta hydrolase [Sphingomonas sp. LK11]
MRRLISFPCEGATLIGTLDEADRDTGLMIVSGGNEPRMGAHRGQAMLAARIAAHGYPVFRFDRRGVGDSEGANGGWTSSGPDIAAAVDAFADAANLSRIVGFGNCDAAAALAMFGAEAGFAKVLLSNPWLSEEPDALPPAAAIRRHYAKKLVNPAEWLRLARGAVDLGKLRQGLTKIAAAPSPLDATAAPLISAIHGWAEDAAIIVAQGDATGVAFRAAARGHGFAIETLATDSHSYADAMDALEKAILAHLARAGSDGATPLYDGDTELENTD